MQAYVYGFQMELYIALYVFWQCTHIIVVVAAYTILFTINTSFIFLYVKITRLGCYQN